ncbi:MAG TPA: patatin-like phospholipase family protein, partial [Gemmatimonadaceae bacterium]|nr:patatin-like phospholipase family protein [Gemmatimonadaceae bacterium]
MLASPLAAQEPSPAPITSRFPLTGSPPTVALVLSGGSAKAFAHIGVLKVVEQVGLPVDLVTGTSMGGIVGGLYAIGYTPAMLERVALGTDWDGVFQGAARRDQLRPAQKLGDGRWVLTFPIRGGRVRLPAGLVPRQRVDDVLTRLTWSVPDARDFRAFPIPFAAVATDLETGESVRLDHGVLSDALQASMALPGVFAPMKLDGHSYVDGGVARNLPAQDARDMGATVVVCVDVSDPLLPADSLESAADVLLQTITFQMQRSNEAQRKLCDVLITPDITGLPATSFTKAAVWIARGEAAAEAVRPRLREIADSVRALRGGSGSEVAGRGL